MTNNLRLVQVILMVIYSGQYLRCMYACVLCLYFSLCKPFDKYPLLSCGAPRPGLIRINFPFLQFNSIFPCKRSQFKHSYVLSAIIPHRYSSRCDLSLPVHCTVRYVQQYSVLRHLPLLLQCTVWCILTITVYCRVV